MFFPNCRLLTSILRFTDQFLLFIEILSYFIHRDICLYFLATAAIVVLEALKNNFTKKKLPSFMLLFGHSTFKIGFAIFFILSFFNLKTVFQDILQFFKDLIRYEFSYSKTF